METERAGILAELDQVQAALRDLAPVFASFHANLVSEGFTRGEATSMTRTLLREIFREAQRG